MPIRRHIKRHKYAIIALGLYWPIIFILTHIEIPHAIRTAGVNDKMMHFLAYMILTLFLWVSIKPNRKVNWLKLSSWITIAIIAAYGGIDEILQSFVHRGTSIKDFSADMVGVAAAMAIMTFFSFWPSSLLISAIFIYTLPNFTTGTLLTSHPLINSAFHFVGFAGFTVIWVQVLDRFLPIRDINFKWFIFALILPVLLLAGLKTTSAVLGKVIGPMDIIISSAGIILIIAISGSISLFSGKIIQNHSDNLPYKY